MEQLTILEGWTFAQMRALLAKEPELRQTIAGRSDEELMAELGAPDVAAEGRFAPDTYSYAAGATTDMQVLRMAFEAQRKNLQEAWDARQPDLPFSTPEEALALASIVEKETGLASERSRVAGVYINRLRKGMRLQSDPTVIYGIRDRYDGNIRKRDLTTDTPYNTYTRSGPATDAHCTAGPRGHRGLAESGEDRCAVLRRHRGWQRRSLFLGDLRRAQSCAEALPRAVAHERAG